MIFKKGGKRRIEKSENNLNKADGDQALTAEHNMILI